MHESAVWVVYIMLGATGFPASDDAKFRTESACQIHRRMAYGKVDGMIKTYCTNIGPLICQGKPCG